MEARVCSHALPAETTPFTSHALTDAFTHVAPSLTLMLTLTLTLTRTHNPKAADVYAYPYAYAQP